MNCPCGQEILSVLGDRCMSCDQKVCTTCIMAIDDITLCKPCSGGIKIQECEHPNCVQTSEHHNIVYCTSGCGRYYCPNCIQFHNPCAVCRTDGCSNVRTPSACQGCGRNNMCHEHFLTHRDACREIFYCRKCQLYKVKPTRCPSCHNPLCTACESFIVCEGLGCKKRFCSRDICGSFEGKDTLIQKHQITECHGIRRCVHHPQEFVLGDKWMSLPPLTICYFRGCKRLACNACLRNSYKPDGVYKMPVCFKHSTTYFELGLRKVIPVCPCCRSMYPAAMYGHFFIRRMRYKSKSSLEVCYSCFLSIQILLDYIILRLYPRETVPKALIEYLLSIIIKYAD